MISPRIIPRILGRSYVQLPPRKEISSILFLGAGNMAKALMTGLVRGKCPPQTITVYSPHTERHKSLTAALGVKTTDRLIPVPPRSAVVLAMKPLDLPSALSDWQPALVQERPLIISVAASVTIETIQHLLDDKMPIIRAMPNLPVQIGMGASGLFASPETTKIQRMVADLMFRTVGATHWVDREELLDVVTALSGSGPAYVLRFLEALENAGVTHGLPRPMARGLAIQTIMGTARMVAAGGDPKEITDRITSRGGTTEAGLGVWDHHLHNLAYLAVKAAIQRCHLTRATMTNRDETA